MYGGLRFDEAQLEREEQVAMAEAGLDPYKQRVMAAGFRDLVENLKGFLAAKESQAHDAGSDECTITAADVADFMAQMNTKRQRTG
eukprot:jgi/Chrzof1/13752/Cz08g10220.t1